MVTVVLLHQLSASQEAIQTCYALLCLVQRLWRKVKDENDDDYIANPKPSGYQSLHTAVIGTSPPPPLSHPVDPAPHSMRRPHV